MFTPLNPGVRHRHRQYQLPQNIAVRIVEDLNQSSQILVLDGCGLRGKLRRLLSAWAFAESVAEQKAENGLVLGTRL